MTQRARRKSVNTIGEILTSHSLHLACTESLTGGELSSALAKAHNSSDWYLGGLVAYERRIKYDVLGVPQGPVVSPEAAMQMAQGLRRLMQPDVAISLTGVAGPDRQDDMPVGTMFVGISSRLGTEQVTHVDLRRRRPPTLVKEAVRHTLDLLATHLEQMPTELERFR